MAYCPNCQKHLPPKEVMTHTITCPYCQRELAFKKKEYKQIIRPGLYIIFVLIFNMFFTEDRMLRMGLNILLLILWFLFYRRLKRYLEETQLVNKGEDEAKL